MRKTSLPTRSIVPKGGPLPSVLEDAHQRRHDEEEEDDDDDESETLLLSRKDANATRRRFDALEEEEENDVHRPPGLSHAAVRERTAMAIRGTIFRATTTTTTTTTRIWIDSSLASTNSSLEKDSWEYCALE